MDYQHQHKSKIPYIPDFPEQPIVFGGEIVAVTKMKTNELRVKISLSDGTYFESNCGNDPALFERLCKMMDIGKKIMLIIK